MMKTCRPVALPALFFLLATRFASAGTVTHSDPQSGGIIYYWTVNLGMNDSASASRFVGAWSWQDSSLFSPGETPVGWTHNSDWIALKLEVPAIVTLRLESQSNVSLQNPFNPDAVASPNLVPGMTVYAGWDNDPVPQAFADANNGGVAADSWHSYSNRGNVEWAEDMRYFTHLEPNGTHVVQVTMLMPAGEYSLAIGGNASSTDDQSRQGYLASFSTSPVPEPATGGLLILGGLATLAARRRR